MSTVVSRDRRTGLDGLSPDYRIRLGRWLEVSQPHFGAIVGPSIGFVFLFIPIYIVIVLLHFVFIGFLLDPFVLPALAIGVHIVCQLQLKGKPWTFTTFFSGFRWTWALAARGILLLVIPAAIILPGFVFVALVANLFPTDPPAIVAGASVAVLVGCVCLAIYVWVRVAFFSHFLIVDRDCGPIESLRGSWVLSRGHFWGLVGTLLLVLAVVYLSGLLTLGIGMFFTLPRAVLMLNAGYLLVAGSEPVAGTERDSERAARRRLLPAWAPAAGFAAAMILFGAFMTAAASLGKAEERRRMSETDRAAELRSR